MVLHFCDEKHYVSYKENKKILEKILIYKHKNRVINIT